jgi:uncharacterized protein (DUF608 family)
MNSLKIKLLFTLVSTLTFVGSVSADLSGVAQAKSEQRKYNDTYTGQYLNHVAFPLGGIGAGMICLEGTGSLSSFSLKSRPEIFSEPTVFSAICVKGDKNVARMLEGPVPKWKIFGPGPDATNYNGAGNGLSGRTYGLPRFAKATFKTRFPFATVMLEDPKIPLKVEITGWSPFTPPEPNDSSLPVAALEYRFTNPTDKTVEAVYSFNSRNFLVPDEKSGQVTKTENGFILVRKTKSKPWEEAAFAAISLNPDTKVNCAWFRGGWFDPLTMAWKDIEQGKCLEKPPISSGAPSPGASIFVPVNLKPTESKTITILLCWYCPVSNVQTGSEPAKTSEDQKPQTYQPWYSAKFSSLADVVDYWQSNYAKLRDKSKQFSDCFYDTTLPDEVIEAVAANLTILKSPTVLRQPDGRLWAWEGCHDNAGCCPGSCTHVWNYAQAVPNLFPSLERTLRETEFCVCQNEKGHQTFRCLLPIRPPSHGFHAASDGQLGGIIKLYRDWRISGDTDWMIQLWPKVKSSLDYCIATWDPNHNGVLSEPHHNTYDIEFWGPDPMCSSFYLGALKAAAAMGRASADEVPLYKELLEKGQKYVNEQLFNGEYYYQQVQWQELHAKNPMAVQNLGGEYSPEAIEIMKKEGPKYQYGKGCLSDGVLGVWLAQIGGVDTILNEDKVTSHLQSIYKYNFKKDLSEHVNPQRPGYAMGNEGGLLLCSWPKGEEPSLPFPYSNEVWTGIEYQVASHLIIKGQIDQGLQIVRTARDRYDGRVRNPFDEYECGHWYARAMSSYALLQALGGARYDALEKVLYLKPAVKGDFKAFLCTATGYGTVGVKNGKPFCNVVSGKIPYEKIEYTAKSKD